jgi:hypothetical protein
MVFKSFDRAFQWAGERIGVEAKTSHSDQFKALENEMNVRHDGMDRLQKSMNTYIKWMSRRGDTFEDGQKGLPINYLGRTMIRHGEDFDPESEFGRCLITLGRAHERMAMTQESHVESATQTWLSSIDRSLAMMKEYQNSRKKLEARRMTFDASTTRQQKARREDFRIEEELRSARAKFEESSEDVVRRMQDIKDSEEDSIRDLTGFMDAEIEYHEKCLEELKRARAAWPASGSAASGRTGRSFSVSATPASLFVSSSRKPSLTASEDSDSVDEPITPVTSAKIPMRSHSRPPPAPPVGKPAPPARASTFNGSPDLCGATQPLANMAAQRAQSRHSFVPGSDSRFALAARDRDIFADHDHDESPNITTSGRSGSPDAWDDRSTFTSPSTSMTSLRSAVGSRKAPPPPPPSRAKKPAPPPIPSKKPSVMHT